MTWLVKAAAGPARVGTPSGSGDGAVAPVSAVIATITPGLVDHDGDAYDPSAFTDSGQALISQWQHSAIYGGGTIPVGVGSVREVGEQAIFDGVIWLGMSAGRDLREFLLRRGADQEWSYGYDVLRARAPGMREHGARQVIQRLAVYEVSPVRRGAGVGTGTVAVGVPNGRPLGPAGGADDGLDAATRAELRAIGERLRTRRDADAAMAAAAVRLIRYQAERRREAAGR